MQSKTSSTGIDEYIRQKENELAKVRAAREISFYITESNYSHSPLAGFIQRIEEFEHVDKSKRGLKRYLKKHKTSVILAFTLFLVLCLILFIN